MDRDVGLVWSNPGLSELLIHRIGCVVCVCVCVCVCGGGGGGGGYLI